MNYKDNTHQRARGVSASRVVPAAPTRERRGRGGAFSERGGGGARRSANHTPYTPTAVQTATHIPSPEDDTVRFLVFGGVEEVGKNLHAMEYRDSIIVLDCGFMFSTVNTPGVDSIVPNIQYLVERKDKVKGIVISHGHLDHIGALPFVIERLGYPPVFSRRLTVAMMQRRQDEHKYLKPVDFREVEENQKIKISDDITMDFFAVTHTIPDSMGVILETPYGGVVYTGDLKLDHEDGVPTEKEHEAFKVFENRKILLSVSDSTNAGRPGFSIPENKVIDNITELAEKADGRIILGSFSSQIDRNINIINRMVAMGKKVVVQGRSMVTNLRIATELDMLKVPKDAIIEISQMDNYPPNRIFVLITGSQGEEFAGLNRMAQGSHRFLKANKTDTIIFSSSIIPGNEQAVWGLKDNLSRFGPTIITFETSDVHSSGHANKGELRWIHERINTKFFIPVHGYHYMLVAHGAILREMGMPSDSIVIPNNGSVIDIKNGGEMILHREESMPIAPTIVDGTNVGELQEVVFTDRKILAQNGMVILSINIDKKTKKVKTLRTTSRGFVYMRESQDLMRKVCGMTRFLINGEIEMNSNYINLEHIKKIVIKKMNNFFLRETGKRPLIVPVIFIANT